MINPRLIRAENALNDEFMQNLLDSLNELFCLYNKDLEILWTNNAAAESLGMKKEELVGKHCYELWGQQNEPCNQCPVLKAIETGEPQTIEKQTPDGRYWRLHGSVTYTEKGSIDHLVETGLDITKEKLVEIELKGNKNKIDTLVKSSAEFIWQVDKNGVYTYVSDNVKDIIGYDKSEIIGKTPFDFMKPSEAKRVGKIFTDIISKTKKIKGLEDSMIHKNGNIIYFETDGIPLFDESGKFYGYFGICRDITDEKNAKNLLELSENKFRKAFECSDTGMALVSPEGKFINVNEKVCDILGYTTEEMISKSFIDITHPDDIEESKKAYFKLVNGKISQYQKEKRYLHKNGQIIYASLTIAGIRDNNGNLLYSVAQLIDKTNEMKALDSLKESEEKFRAISDYTIDLEWWINTDGKLIWVNKAIKNFTGYNYEESLKIDCHKFFIEDDREKFKNLLKNGLKNKTKINEVDFTFIKKDKSELDVSLSWQPVYFSDGKWMGIRASFRDISERKIVEKELNRLSASVRQSPSVIVMTDLDGNIIFSNPKFSEITGYSNDEVIGKNPNILKSGELKEEVYKNLWKTIKSGMKWRGEFHNKRKDGRLYWEKVSIAPIFDSHGKIINFLKVAEDITREKKYQDELRNSEEKLRIKNIDLKLAQKIAMVGNWTLDPEVGVPEWSDMVYEIYERDPDKGPIPVKDYKKLYQGKDWETFHNAITNASQKGIAYDIELQPNLPSGKKKWIRAICKPEKHSKNSNYFLRGTIQDITKEKKAEEKLRETLKATTEGIWNWNFKTNELFFSDRYYTMLGYSPQEFEANFENWKNLIHPNDREKAISIAEEYLKTKPDLYENEFRLKTKNGEYRWITAQGRVVQRDKNGEAIRMIGRHEDNTDRIIAEKKLQKIFDLSSDLLCEADINTATFTKINPAFTHILGYSEEELLSTTFLDFIHPNDKEKTIKAIEKQVKKGEKLISFTNRYRCKDGSYVWLDWNSHPDSNNDFVYGIARNVTDQVHNAKKMRSMNEYLNDIIDSASEIIIVINQFGKIEKWNRSIENLTGYKKKEVIGKKIDSLDVFTFPKEFNEMIKQVFKGNKPDFDEYQMISKLREQKIIKTSYSILYDTDKNVKGLIFIGKDVTLEREIHGNLIRGMSYQISSDKAVSPKIVFKNLLKENNQGLWITRYNKKSIYEQNMGNQLTIAYLNNKKIENMDTLSNINELIKYIHSFCKTHNNSIILFDRIDYLINRFSFKEVINAIYDINNIIVEHRSILLFDINPSILTDQQYSMISEELELISNQNVKEIQLPEKLYDIMAYVHDQTKKNTSVTYKKISSKFSIVNYTVKKRIEELEQMNLVFIKKVGRSKTINLTEKGVRLLNKKTIL